MITAILHWIGAIIMLLGMMGLIVFVALVLDNLSKNP